MENLVSTQESLSQHNVLADALAKVCESLIDAINWTVESFEKISDYSVKALQGVSRATRQLFVDVIVMQLKKVALLVKELAHEGSHNSHHIINFHKKELMSNLDRSNFLRQTFGAEIERIFSF